MGVFARLLRRSKAAEEASTAEAGAATPTAEPEAEKAAEATESAEAETTAGTDAGDTAEPTATEAVEAGAAEGVDIPKQQSADEAAAGEGART